MKDRIEVAARGLPAALQRAGLASAFSPLPQEVLDRVTGVLPVSRDLRTWYRTSAPLDAEVPWYAEDLRLFDPRDLLEWQDGYRWPAGHREALDPGWDANWLVIGDWAGDPLIAHTDRAGTPISTALHGIGSWRPYLIAPTWRPISRRSPRGSVSLTVAIGVDSGTTTTPFPSSSAT